MNIAIVGSRSITDIDLSQYIDLKPVIISGGARGIDTLARKFARDNKLKLIELKPNYDRYGPKAPHVRNTEIIKMADFVYIFWDGKSKGTKAVIEKCRRNAKPYKIIPISL